MLNIYIYACIYVLIYYIGKSSIPANLLSKAPPLSACALQVSGYFTAEMTLGVMQHFVKHATQQRPLLLLLDGAKIHIELEALK